MTLGIPGSPGSLLLTLLGGVVSRIPIVHPVAFRLNLFAALLAASLVGLVCWLGARLATPEGDDPRLAEWSSGSFAGLVFAFGVTPWTYAVQFTPYVLSALWTALVLVAALGWWRRPETSPGRLRLLLLFLLLGLDFSVHRTNALLLPAALVWILIRSPRARGLRDTTAAISGLLLGLAFHLLLIPLAARQPTYMAEDPGTWAGFWDYVSMGRVGGGFLVNLFPRRAPFFSVQVADYLAFLSRNLGVALFLPALLAAVGWILILRHHPRRAIGLMVFFLCAGPGAILYFNLPPHYMRSIERHYLPSLVIVAPWMAVGTAALLRRASRLRGHVALVPASALTLLLVPLVAWRAHHPVCDRSRDRFAETFARNLLEPLPPRAILLTNGDNDSFPLWYMQQAEGVRPDVAVINLPLANTGFYVARLRRSDPIFTPLLANEPLPGVLAPGYASVSVLTWVDPRADLGLPTGVAAPDTVRFGLPELQYGEDRVVLGLLRLNRWRRPIFLAITVDESHLGWLRPYARLDGLTHRIVPTTDPEVHDVDHWHHQLFDRVSYAGLADTTIAMDADTRALFANYVASLTQLASAEAARGRTDAALATLRFMEEHVPPQRLGFDSNQIARWRAQLEETAKRRRTAE